MAQKAPAMKAPSMKCDLEASAPAHWLQDHCEDYDAMGNDTDHEEMMQTVFRGYLSRSSGCCSTPTKRWCELSTNGCLHISGNSLLVVDIAAGSELVLQPADHPAAWKVRNNSSNTWELLEAEEDEAKHWDMAFSDALRLGVAEHNEDAAFSGFFWKLNHNVGEDSIASDFNFADWRCRLFVLQNDGQVLIYSWKEKEEKVFIDFSVGSPVVEKMPFTWRDLPHTVPFQIIVAGQQPRILACREEDYNVFIALVSRIRSELGCGGVDRATCLLPLAPPGSILTEEGYVTKW